MNQNEWFRSVTILDSTGTPVCLAQDMTRFIPEFEADILYLHYGCGKNQTEISNLVGTTQANISYRLHKALRRLHYIDSLPKPSLGMLQTQLEPCVGERGAMILMEMYRTSCQTIVANQLKWSQGKVRYYAMEAVNALKESGHIYADMFVSVMSNPNMLHECTLPHFLKNRKGNQIIDIPIDIKLGMIREDDTVTIQDKDSPYNGMVGKLVGENNIFIELKTATYLIKIPQKT
jgi:hypothetical protein